MSVFIHPLATRMKRQTVSLKQKNRVIKEKEKEEKFHKNFNDQRQTRGIKKCKKQKQKMMPVKKMKIQMTIFVIWDYS